MRGDGEVIDVPSPSKHLYEHALSTSDQPWPCQQQRSKCGRCLNLIDIYRVDRRIPVIPTFRCSLRRQRTGHGDQRAARQPAGGGTVLMAQLREEEEDLR